MRSLLAFAFLPEAEVVEAVVSLADIQLDDIEHLDELTSFFQHTYLRGCRQRGRGKNYGYAMYHGVLWNQYTAGMDGIGRTTISLERWFLGSLFNLTNLPYGLWTFLRKTYNCNRLIFCKDQPECFNQATKI